MKNNWWGRQRENQRDPIRKHWDRLIADPRFREDNGIIDSFYGPYSFLSNFASCLIEYEGEKYISTEHAYQAAKTNDPNWKEVIRLAETPTKCKRKGSQAPLREDWEQIKDDVMRNVLRLKFSEDHPVFRQMLLDTHPQYLVEGNSWHDNYWGICLLHNCPKCESKQGRNMLGNLLMEIREEILIQRLQEELDAAKEIDKK